MILHAKTDFVSMMTRYLTASTNFHTTCCKGCTCPFLNGMSLADADGLSKIRLNYSDESAEGSKMLDDELIDFSEDQDNQVKPNAWQKDLIVYLMKSFSCESYR